MLNPEHSVSTFKKNVNLMTYGDDNIMSVSRECDWFNHSSISETFATLNIVYTMADKESESVPFINIEDASFLKRTWRMDDRLGCYVAPLEEESIEKSLMVWTRSKAVTKEVQGIDVISSALREYFWYGEETYNEKLCLLKGLVKDLGWELWVQDSTFPTYSDLCNDFVNRSKRCTSYQTIFGLDEQAWSVQSKDIPLEEYDFLIYPNSQSTTNYDISVHTWMFYAFVYNFFQRYVMYTMLACFLLPKVRLLITPCHRAAVLSSFQMAVLCRQPFLYVGVQILSFLVTQLLTKMILLIIDFTVDLNFVVIPYLALRYFVIKQ